MPSNQESQETKRAALYARHSGEDEGSIETQLGAMRSHAEENGLEVVREYPDQQGSRTGFEEMMAEATGENPPFQEIIFWDIGRLTRSAQEFQDLKAKLEANGITVISIT